MSKYKYSFTGARIEHCYECGGKYINMLGNYSCGIPGGENIECSDISRPDDCPLTENEIRVFKCETCKYDYRNPEEIPCNNCLHGGIERPNQKDNFKPKESE